jgi:hypothetical protein
MCVGQADCERGRQSCIEPSYFSCYMHSRGKKSHAFKKRKGKSKIAMQARVMRILGIFVQATFSHGKRKGTHGN